MDPDSQGRGREHVPVLGEAVVRFLGRTEAGAGPVTGWVVDGTLGAGGHAALLLEALPGIRLFGLDQDPAALEIAATTLERFGDRVRLRHARLSQLSRTLREEGIEAPVGMLFDLGVSSMQLDRAERGFSFAEDGPLDMRMDPGRERTAADIVNHWDESDLADLIFYEGGEHHARRVAREIVEARRFAPFRRTMALADVIARATGRAGGRIHPATRTFQALRRAVNEEGEELTAALLAARCWLAPQGRLAVISFHSGEDRAAKRFLAEGAKIDQWRILTRKPAVPEADELRLNRRARSSRLRVAERLPGPVVEGCEAGSPFGPDPADDRADKPEAGS